jgi:phosphoribosylanthranilate isomerase
MIIKASAIRTLTDARYFSSQAVEWIGFCFDPESADFIHPREAQQIIKWLEGPKIMGEFRGQTAAEVRETVLILGLHGIQLGHHDVTEDYLSIPVPKIIEIPVSDLYNYLEVNRIADGLEHVAEFISLNITPHYTSWDNFIAHGNLTVLQLEKLCNDHRIMLGSNFTGVDVREILQIIKPRALNIAGSMESKTGEKDFEQLNEVFECLHD